MNSIHEFLQKFLIHRYRLLRYRFLLIMDYYKNVDLTEAVSVEDLHLDPEKSRMYYASSPTLKRILKKLEITDSDKIIDIGCGKGRALYYMSKYPFQLISGVEISYDLVEICKKNLEKLGISNYVIYNMDACAFTKYDLYNYIYFYNPFCAEILEQCLDNIKKSLYRKPRKITIIYHNPVYSAVIQKYGFELTKKLHYNRFYIYESRT